MYLGSYRKTTLSDPYYKEHWIPDEAFPYRIKNLSMNPYSPTSNSTVMGI